MEASPFSQEGPLNHEHPRHEHPRREHPHRELPGRERSAPDPVLAPGTVARLHALLTAVPLPEVDDGTWRRLVATALGRLGSDNRTEPPDRTGPPDPRDPRDPPRRPEPKDPR
ncbi:hypothetical protein ACIPYS_20120 [Kitasatospora sp. NPDC089913]|uniref:hypothetical protein n=1 Tax=Kitasatospora sp. NPDC089913 TaxID=3364080 RepID=UPI00380BF07E